MASSISDIHVLIVDDNAQMRFLLRCLLRAGGILDVSEAESADLAFAQMRKRAADLIIVDWMMQPIDGLAFTRMTRRDAGGANPYVPILMLSAHTEASRVAAARDAGVTGFIKKPISARILFERVSGALSDTRTFICTNDFMGPDRRHGQVLNYPGPFRRMTDGALARLNTIDVDDVAGARATARSA